MFRAVTIAAILALSITSAQAGPSALADPADRVNSISVSFGDLDLSQPADARVLVQRLRQVAKIVCPSVRAFRDDGSTAIAALTRRDNCVDQATRNAVNEARTRQAAAGGAETFAHR